MQKQDAADPTVASRIRPSWLPCGDLKTTYTATGSTGDVGLTMLGVCFIRQWWAEKAKILAVVVCMRSESVDLLII